MIKNGESAQGLVPAGDSPAWYAVHTRSRHERKVDTELKRQAFETFLPEYQAWSRRKDRRKKILKPLFPGYLFVQTTMSADRRLAVLQTNSVVRIVGSGYQPVPIPDHEIESVRLLLAGADDAEPHDSIASGRLVQVMDGPLQGVIGVVQKPGKRRIVVNVEMLGRSVAASVKTDALVPYLD